MDAPLSVFAGWHFLVGCTPCRLLAQVDVDYLLRTHGDPRVVVVVAKLKCSRCREWPAAVTLAEGHAGDGRAERRRVELIP
jgi:hypothetical protein